MNQQPATILIVDQNRQRVNQSLQTFQSEFTVVPADSAEAALAVVTGRCPGLLLVDGRGGQQAFAEGVLGRCAAQARAGGALAAVLAEAGDGAAARRLLQMGADELIHEDPGLPEVAVRLRRLLELGRRQVRAALLECVVETMLEGVLVTDCGDRIVDANPAFCALTGYSRAELLGQTPALLQSGRHDPAFFRGMWDALTTTGKWSGEIWNRMKNGEVYPQQVSICAIRGRGGEPAHYLALFTDLRMVANRAQQLERLAYYDPLTDLPNRALLEDRIHHAIAHTLRYGGLLAVGYLDLDGFSAVQERIGRPAADRVLLEVAKRLKELLRAGDTVARIGSDEFVFLLIGVENQAESESISGRIIKLIAEPMAIDGLHLDISASVGLTFAPTDCINPQTLIAHAEAAMEQVKAAGKNGLRVYPTSEESTAG